MYFPKILLLGNGLNLCCDGTKWEEIIKKIHTNKKVSVDVITKNNIPFPLQAVLASDDSISDRIKNINEELFSLSDDGMIKISPMMDKLLSLPFDYILTTNYSYEIEYYVYGKNVNIKELANPMSEKGRVEPKFMLHTYNSINYKGLNHKIFHIHGEARKPSSMVLGHYYYARLLDKYQRELDASGKKQYFIQRNGGNYKISSWLDAFIFGDVYSLGFGFDFSEIDLWWLLCRKKNEKVNHGKFVFYEPLCGNEVKQSLITCYGGITENVGYVTSFTNQQYRDFYEEAIEDIANKIKQ